MPKIFTRTLTLALLVMCFIVLRVQSDEPTTVKDPKVATKEHPFINSLGMKFVPVPITGGPTDGKKILFSVWDARVQDYDVFVKEMKVDHDKPTFEQGPTHPVVNVSWDDSVAFCEWLSTKEKKIYRLPSDHEWSCAAGIGDRERAEQTPEEKNEIIAGIYPWGKQWPPISRAGNYLDETAKEAKVSIGCIDGYRDGYAFTSPVGAFRANSSGLFDLGGNVYQWCQDWYNSIHDCRVKRGGSWWNGSSAGNGRTWRVGNNPDETLLSSARNRSLATLRDGTTGFRCVLEVSGK